MEHQRIVFLNGKFVPEGEASLPIFDRGLLFADAVYEGFGILDGQIVDFIYHMQRLEQSLAKIAIPITFTIDSMFYDMMAVIEKNAVTNGFLYLHVTRGVGDRAFHYMMGIPQTYLPLPKVKNLPLMTCRPRLP